jgi:hypothetical protein
MKKFLIFSIAALFIFTSVYADETSQRFKSRRNCGISLNNFHLDNGHHLNNIDIDVDDGIIILEGHGGYDGVIEINENHELFVNGQIVRLDDDQKELIADFYDNFMFVIDEAKVIGLKGAGIGLEGAKLGFSAIGCLFKMLSADYDEEDMEREMEARAELLEEKAELLEEHAEVLEEAAEELEDIFFIMEEEIPEIRELEWY